MSGDRTLLVFGGGGQLGRALAASQPGAGWRVRCLAREEADILEPAEIRRAIAAHAPAAVVNAAAWTAVDRAESEPERAFAANRDGAGLVAEACAADDLPLVHVSTDYVFDGVAGRPYREEDPIAPRSVYGASKAAGETAVRERAPRHAILRTAWLFSEFGQSFVRTMLRLARDGREIRVVDDQIGCPTPAVDLAAAIIGVADGLANGAAGGVGTFHYCGAEPVSWHGFARAIFEAAARHGLPPPPLAPIPTSGYPTPAPRPAWSVLDCGRIARVYGIAQPDWRARLGPCVERLLARETVRT